MLLTLRKILDKHRDKFEEGGFLEKFYPIFFQGMLSPLKGEVIPFPRALQTGISDIVLYLETQMELDAHTLPFCSTHEYFET